MKIMALIPVDTFDFRCVVQPFRSLEFEQIIPILAEANDTERARLIFDLFESCLAPDKLQEFQGLSFDSASAVIEVWMQIS